MKQLLAEDDPASARILRTWMEKQGHEVRVATNGAEAWRAFVAGRILVMEQK